MYAEGYSDGYAAGVRAAKLALRKPRPEEAKLLDLHGKDKEAAHALCYSGAEKGAERLNDDVPRVMCRGILVEQYLASVRDPYTDDVIS